MREFAKLFHDLDQSTKTNDRIELLVNYFSTANEDDSIWVCWFLSGNRIKGAIKTGELRLFSSERSGLPLWLIEESHDRVGDLAETISLLIGKRESKQSISLNKLITEYVEPMISLNLDGRREKIFKIWDLSNRV